MTFALLNRPSESLADCELTFVGRSPIDFHNAEKQHSAYARALEELGAEVCMLKVNDDMPDGVFIEDTAVVLDELAIITSMGTPSRRGELPAVAAEIRKYRETIELPLPATLEGGDVLRVGRTLYVGETVRTNRDAFAWLTETLKQFSYKVVPVSVSGCLHLKTGITALDEDTFLANQEWIDLSPFEGKRVIELPDDEPFGGNVLVINGTVLMNAAYPRTVEKVASLGFSVKAVDISEFVKAEAGLTCMSLIFCRMS